MRPGDDPKRPIGPHESIRVRSYPDDPFAVATHGDERGSPVPSTASNGFLRNVVAGHPVFERGMPAAHLGEFPRMVLNLRNAGSGHGRTGASSPTALRSPSTPSQVDDGVPGGLRVFDRNDTTVHPLPWRRTTPNSRTAANRGEAGARPPRDDRNKTGWRSARRTVSPNLFGV